MLRRSLFAGFSARFIHSALTKQSMPLTAQDQCHDDAKPAAYDDLKRRMPHKKLQVFFRKLRFVRFSKMVEISVKSRACFPVSCRTPIASCITIIARINVTANSNDASPYVSADAVASAQTVAECPLGIPPSPKKALPVDTAVDNRINARLQYLRHQPSGKRADK